MDASGVAPRIEARLPVGVRPRQLSVRTLLVGMLLTQADHRAAHLTGVHHQLLSLPGPDRRRLGVDIAWRHGPHTLTYRQTEYVVSLVVGALAKDEPDGTPAGALQEVLDALVETSVAEHARDTPSLAIDWTDVESFSTRRKKPDGTYCAIRLKSATHSGANRPPGPGEIGHPFRLIPGTRP